MCVCVCAVIDHRIVKPHILPLTQHRASAAYQRSIGVVASRAPRARCHASCCCVRSRSASAACSEPPGDSRSIARTKGVRSRSSASQAASSALPARVAAGRSHSNAAAPLSAVGGGSGDGGALVERAKQAACSAWASRARSSPRAAAAHAPPPGPSSEPSSGARRAASSSSAPSSAARLPLSLAAHQAVSCGGSAAGELESAYAEPASPSSLRHGYEHPHTVFDNLYEASGPAPAQLLPRWGVYTGLASKVYNDVQNCMFCI